MTFEIKKYYIFLIFLCLHFIYWGNVDGELTTYILGDWMDIWRNITQLENYLYLHPYARIFYTIETYTGFSLYFGMVFFSIVNTLLIVVLIKTVEVFNKKYSVLVVILLLLMPTTIPNLLGMYKDNLSYLAFALMLLVIARSFSDKPLSLTKTIVFYLGSIYLTVYSREVYIYYITALLGLGLLFSFLLRLRQPLSYSKSAPLLVIFILHLGYFYGGFHNDSEYKINTEYWHDNGLVKSKFNYNNDLLDGKATEWYKSGQIKSEKNYKNGSLVGARTIWHESGQIKEKYIDGGIKNSWFARNIIVLEEGTWFEFYYNNQIKSKTNYKNGLLDGKSTEWYANGQLKSEKNYKNGLLEGSFSIWDRNGLLEVMSNYKSGLLSSSWYPNGQLKKENNYNNDLLDGKSFEWYENGQLKIVNNYNNGELDGKSTEWHANSQLKIENNYNNGELDGKSTELYDNGQLKKENNYNNDLLDGKSFEWYENGQLKLEEDYNKGNLVLDYRVKWNPNGQIMEKYKDNNKEGPWTKFFSGVNIESIYNYKDGKLDGKLTTWHRQGGKSLELNYKNGIIIGEGTKWYQNGSIELDIQVEDQRIFGKHYEWNQNGDIKSVTDWELDKNFLIGFKGTPIEIYKNLEMIRKSKLLSSSSASLLVQKKIDTVKAKELLEELENKVALGDIDLIKVIEKLKNTLESGQVLVELENKISSGEIEVTEVLAKLVVIKESKDLLEKLEQRVASGAEVTEVLAKLESKLVSKELLEKVEAILVLNEVPEKLESKIALDAIKLESPEKSIALDAIKLESPEKSIGLDAIKLTEALLKLKKEMLSGKIEATEGLEKLETIKVSKAALENKIVLGKLKTSENITEIMALIVTAEKAAEEVAFKKQSLQLQKLIKKMEQIKIKDEVHLNIQTDVLRQLSWFADKIKERKGNIVPGSLNYNDQNTKNKSDAMLLISHIPRAIFAPNILLIKNVNFNGYLKAVFILETLINYILALSVFYFFIRSKSYEKFFIILLFILMYITILVDTNYGTYLRHSLVFVKLFLGLGLVNLLYILKLDINFNMRKGLL